MRRSEVATVVNVAVAAEPGVILAIGRAIVFVIAALGARFAPSEIVAVALGARCADVASGPFQAAGKI